ncbi:MULTISPECIES: hypothetical protein [unclassified Flavobacterium]|uniref:hypothetical protein n=1 Tax=unclassified Flavobacterium TaxID=196869 RepID=UPI001F13EE95|nr:MULTISPECIES: hypothetical protein [unclassified Flavobacterium]UMY65616.1 hypothetical protein MKO97_14075 [Flavobacterium sp. HJ-32-4]
MKKSLFILAFLGLSLSHIACSEDDSVSGPTASGISNIVQDGSWKVTLYSEDGVDQTSNFNGYSFTFGSTMVVTAANSSNSYTGTWLVTDNGADDDSASSDVDFSLLFTDPVLLTELNEDWDVISSSSTKIQLRHISGGDGSVDNLTFEKVTL